MIVKGKKKILPPSLPLWFIARLVAPNSPVKVGKNLRPSHGNPRSQPRPNGIQTHLSLCGCSTRAGEVLRKADSIRTLGVFFPLSYFGQRKKKNLVGPQGRTREGRTDRQLFQMMLQALNHGSGLSLRGRGLPQAPGEICENWGESGSSFNARGAKHHPS